MITAEEAYKSAEKNKKGSISYEVYIEKAIREGYT